MENQANSRRIVIFDLDGCLTKDQWRRATIPEGARQPKEFELYHSMCDRDEPNQNAIDRLESHIQNGDMIAIATARPSLPDVGQKTVEWIKSHTSLKDPNSFILMMRNPNDDRSAVDVKREMAGYIKHYADKMALQIAVAYDDRDDVKQMWLSEGIPAAVLDHERQGDELEWPNGFGVAYGFEAKQEAAPVGNVNGDKNPGQGSEPQDARVFFQGHVSTQHVAERLIKAINTFNERAMIYGQNDIIYARVMAELFPNGLTLSKAEDFRMFMNVMHLVGKLTRFTGSGMKDADSVHDMITYSAFAELLAGEHNIFVQPV